MTGKSKPHLTKKWTTSDFQFQLITTKVCPDQVCPAKFAQTQVCPGQICPDPYLPKPNLPRAKFAPKEVYVSKNQQNCQISMDWDTEISNFYDIFAIISLLLSNF